jgi:hypothetical protein
MHAFAVYSESPFPLSTYGCLVLGSLLFVFLLTAVGNLEKTVFGHGFQTQLAEVQ